MKSSYVLVGALPVILAWSVGCSAGGDSGPLGGIGEGSSPSAAAGSLSGGGPAGGMAAGGSPITAGNSSIGGTGIGSGGATGQAGSAVQQAGSSGTGGGGTGGGGAGGGGAGGGGAGGAGPVPTDGKGIYDFYCKQCHGEQGASTQLAPEIQHPVREYSTWVVRNGRAQTTFLKPMDKWGTDKLTDAQLTLIWDYLDQPPQPTTGKGLYDDYCANCHGADGKGGPTMRNIITELAKVMTQPRVGKNVGQYAMRHDSMPIFTTTRISDAELMLIRNYISTL